MDTTTGEDVVVSTLTLPVNIDTITPPPPLSHGSDGVPQKETLTVRKRRRSERSNSEEMARSTPDSKSGDFLISAKV